MLQPPHSAHPANRDSARQALGNQPFARFSRSMCAVMCAVNLAELATVFSLLMRVSADFQGALSRMSLTVWSVAWPASVSGYITFSWFAPGTSTTSTSVP